MKIYLKREDFEILNRLTDCFMKTFNVAIIRFPDDEELSRLAPLVTILFENFRELIETLNLNYNNLNLNAPFDDSQSSEIQKLFEELETLSDNLYFFLDKRHLAKVFKKFLKYRTHSMIRRESEKIYSRLLI